jgi:integrase
LRSKAIDKSERDRKKMAETIKDKLAQFDPDSQRLVEQWLQGKARTTRETYLTYLIQYCEQAGKSPKQLLEERTVDYTPKEEETATESLLRRKRAEKEFQSIFKELEEDLASSTINTARLIVKAFYSYIGFPMSPNDTQYREADERKYKDVALSESDYKALVDAGDYKEKLRVVWLAQTGMRVGDAQRFKVSDLTEYDLEKLEATKTPICIEYTPQKTKGRIGKRYTFLGERGIELLSAELKYRISKEGIEAVKNQYVFQGQEQSQLSAVQWTSMLRELAKKAQLKLNGKYGRIRAHCFRKFFDSVLTGKNVNSDIVHWFMGHKLQGQQETYFQGQSKVEELRQIYAGIEQYLTPITEKVVVEKTIIPTEVTEQMANMYKDISTLQKELKAEKEMRVKLSQDFKKIQKDLQHAMQSIMEQKEDIDKVKIVKPKGE